MMKTQLFLFTAGLCGWVAECANNARMSLLNRVFSDVLVKTDRARSEEKPN